ncbi:uncharacterized protein AB675_257 [Cyphellophora attinorum]|uniref:Uncharacterized protein n=1 Tax=Cyphellophora attinorum TaxID=1664694 RepID=A0A0N1HHN2_9EURO|nr:uncharacterized protein AB675_257 [Phialophora attinorum]KPI45566.1 hypothetical protein AB675_257 [Phialophora attinorum]
MTNARLVLVFEKGAAQHGGASVSIRGCKSSSYDHKPIREWTAGITLNAVISILITILDAALALPLASGFGQLKWVLLKRKKQILQDLQQLDYASRSTTGSFTLLLSLRGSIIGSLGAVLAILVLAVGPFAQQVVSVSLKEEVTGQASLGKAVNATEMLTISMGGEGAVASAALPMRAAYYNALYGFPTSGSLPNPPFTCPSGNCTWDPFVSLAVCSECRDIGELVQRVEWTSFSTYANISYVTWALPNEYNNLNISITVDTQYANLTNRFSDGIMNVTSIWSQPGGDRFPLEGSFMAIALLNGSAANPLEVTALDCSLRVCLNEIRAQTHNGEYTETRTEIEKTVAQEISSNYAWGYVPKDPRWEGSIFMVLGFFVYELQTMIGNMFNGTAYDNRNHSLKGGTLAFESDVMLSLWEGGNLAAHLEYITRSISIHMREQNSPGADFAIGSSHTTEAYYTVRWLWLILPSAVVVLVATFSLVLMVESRRTRASLWKNSMLATLFHGLDDSARGRLVAEHSSG